MPLIIDILSYNKYQNRFVPSWEIHSIEWGSLIVSYKQKGLGIKNSKMYFTFFLSEYLQWNPCWI